MKKFLLGIVTGVVVGFILGHIFPTPTKIGQDTIIEELKNSNKELKISATNSDKLQKIAINQRDEAKKILVEIKKELGNKGMSFDYKDGKYIISNDIYCALNSGECHGNGPRIH